jgi:hypothetical protein
MPVQLRAYQIQLGFEATFPKLPLVGDYFNRFLEVHISYEKTWALRVSADIVIQEGGNLA